LPHLVSIFIIVAVETPQVEGVDPEVGVVVDH